MKLLKAQLRSIKDLEARINPSPEWTLRNREQLIRQIEHTSSQARIHIPEAPKVAHSFNTWAKIFVPQKLVRSLKPLSSVALALMLTTLGWIASAYAEPGDMLWNAKTAFNSVVETSRLALAPESKQASLKLSYASKQAHILKQVVETDSVGGEEKAKLVEKTADSLQKKLDSAQESIKTIDVQNVENLVKEVSLSAQDISQTLKETLEISEAGGIQTTIEKTSAETTKQSLEMVGDVVQKKTEANLEISNEEKEIVKDHIDQAVESIVAEAMRAQNKLNNQSTSTQAVSVSSTPIVTQISTSTATNVGTSVTTTTTISEQKKTVETLKETNLLEAINTTKILAEQVTTVIEKIQTQIPATVPSSTPSVSVPTTSVNVSTSTTSSTTSIKNATST